jgi:DNA-binding NarL/FixJ family response regulator
MNDISRIRIVIADDHPVVRKGLRALLAEHPGLTVVGEAGDGETALALIDELRPDVAVLDVDMPRLDGFAIVRAVAGRSLPVRLIFLTLHDDEELFREAMELGVHGYLLKDGAMIEIAAAVRAVAGGRQYLSSDMTSRLLQPRSAVPAGDSVAVPLTPAEQRVMRLLADGRSSKEIGEALEISYRTVENHRTRICRKLGLEGANALLRFAIQHKSRF